ncbi:hypothetical protein Micbo1qcDRAFT_11088 [Microdochium bolleyi]|uniref:Uncharacterized protein n=1 Tax=Microdochium bolleyi TaxID=196109 RepID=A0A136IY82_9PEZI|nr:hypothetical protein Micbo1qcDRAFT_11088 [Microdochium bolleyi]
MRRGNDDLCDGEMVLQLGTRARPRRALVWQWSTMACPRFIFKNLHLRGTRRRALGFGTRQEAGQGHHRKKLLPRPDKCCAHRASAPSWCGPGDTLGLSTSKACDRRRSRSLSTPGNNTLERDSRRGCDVTPWLRLSRDSLLTGWWRH